MHDMDDNRRALIALTYLTEPCDQALSRLLGLVTPEEAIGIIATADTVRASESVRQLVARARPRLRAGKWEPIADEIIATMQVLGMDFIIPSDAAYPSQVTDLATADADPIGLYTRGNTLLLSEGKTPVAVVGARAATGYGEHIAMEMGADLVLDHALVSGAAYGIDGAIHRAALAVGGQTIAVLAGGLDRPYPMGHSDLIRRIIENGVAVSELPPSSSPTKWRFLQRNRIIAALGRATVVVEAGWRSGSLNTASHAEALGRPVGAVPGPLTSAASTGCHRLIREHGAHLITSANDVRELTKEASA